MPPKEHIARDMTQFTLHSQMLHGKRHVTAAIALKLEKLLGIPAEYWMRVQVYYDLFVERNKQSLAA